MIFPVLIVVSLPRLSKFALLSLNELQSLNTSCSVLASYYNRRSLAHDWPLFVKCQVRIAALQAINGMVQCGLTANMVAAHLAPGVKPLAFDHTTTDREVTSQIPCHHHHHHHLLLCLPRVQDEIHLFFVATSTFSNA